MSPHHLRATLLASQGRHADAVSEFQLALSEAPNEALLYAELALSLSRIERYDAADEAAQQAIALNPNLADAHYVAAVVKAQRHDFAAARRALTSALDLDPDEPSYHALSAELWQVKSDWPLMLTAAEAGLALDPAHPACNNLRAHALTMLGRRDEAGATMEATLARDPDDSYTHANQGWNLLHAGDHQQAMVHFREALRLDPEDEWAKQGVVESLKARHGFYGPTLRFTLWLMRGGGRRSFYVVVGYFLSLRVLERLEAAHPQQAMVFAIAHCLIVGAMAMIFFSNQLYTLILRSDPLGRHVLSTNQVRASNAIIAGILLGGAGVILTWCTGAFQWKWLGFDALCVAAITSLIWNCQPGWPRQVMTGVSALAGLLWLLLTVLVVSVALLPAQELILLMLLVNRGVEYVTMLGIYGGIALSFVVPRK